MLRKHLEILSFNFEKIKKIKEKRFAFSDAHETLCGSVDTCMIGALLKFT